MLYFVDGTWPIFRPPDEFREVRLESERSVQKLFADPVHVNVDAIDRSSRVPARALPPKLSIPRSFELRLGYSSVTKASMSTLG